MSERDDLADEEAPVEANAVEEGGASVTGEHGKRPSFAMRALSGNHAMRRVLIVALFVSIATMVGLFVFSFYTQRDALIESLSRLDPLVFLIAIGLHLSALLLWAVRLVLLTDGAGYRVSFAHAAEAVFAGVFVAALTPARLGGEPVRFAVLNSRGVPPREASLLVLMERGLDVLLFIVLGVIASIVLIPRLPQSAILAIAVPAGIVFLVLLIVLPLIVVLKPRWVHPLMHVVGRFVQAERLERAKEWLVLEMARVRRALATVLSRKPSRVPLAIVATALSWGLEFAVLGYLLYAFGHEIPYLLVAMGAVLVMLLTTLPLLPGGSGVAEVGAMGIFSTMTSGLTPTFILVWRLTTYYADTAIGGVFAVRFAGAETRRVLESQTQKDG